MGNPKIQTTKNTNLKPPNPKSKDWEKNRRDKLGDAFKLLAQLLPHHDPAKLPTRIHILNRATDFIKELRLSNSRLLTSKDQPNELCTKIHELQDEVNKLILRVKQLTTLLDQAKIPIPQGPTIQSLGKREFKWSRKLSAQDVENLGILLNSGKSIIKSKKTKVTLHAISNRKVKARAQLEKHKVEVLKDLESDNFAKKNDDESKETSKESTADSRIPILLQKEPTCLNPDPKPLELTEVDPAPRPTQTSAQKDLDLKKAEPNPPPPPKTQIFVTNLPSSTSATINETKALEKNIAGDVISNKKDSNSGTSGTAADNNKTINSITISPVKSLSLNLLQPQMVTSTPLIFTPLTLVSTPSFRTLAPLLPKVQPGVIQKLPISRIRQFVPKKIRSRKKRKVKPPEEKVTVERKDVPTTSATADQEPNSPLPEVINLVEEEQVTKNDELKNDVQGISQVSSVLNSNEEVCEETKVCKSPKEIPEAGVEEMDTGIEPEELTNVTNNVVSSPEESVKLNDQPKESKTAEVDHEISMTQSSCVSETITDTADNSVQQPTSQIASKSPQLDTLASTRESSSVQAVAIVTQVENTQGHRNNDRNDVFNFNDENASPSCTSPVKISECIARSIGISMEQDEVESDLMELNTDWTGVVDPSCSQSPKSCISPTQMFLSCFPLLPRDGNISTELSTQIQPSFIKSAPNASANPRQSSFFINAMLPNDPNHLQPASIIDNPFSVSSSLSKKASTQPTDSFEKVLAPLQTFKSNKLLPLTSTNLPTAATASANSLDLYSDKGLMWFSDYLNPVNKDPPSTSKPFPRIVPSHHDKQSHPTPLSDVRSLPANPTPKNHSKEIAKSQGVSTSSTNVRPKYSKTQPTQVSKDSSHTIKEKELPRIPIPEHQPQFTFPIQTSSKSSNSKSRTPQNQSSALSHQTTPQKQRQFQGYPYQSIENIIDYQSPYIPNSSEYQRKVFPSRTETVSQSQYSTSLSRSSQHHSHHGTGTTNQPTVHGFQVQHQPSASVPKSSNQTSFSSNNEQTRYTLPTYPQMSQANRNDIQNNQVTYPPPPVYQASVSTSSRIPSSTAPLYLTPPTPCENSTRAVTFPPSVQPNSIQCQMDYSQLADTTYHADFSSHSHNNPSTNSVGMNHELNSYFGTSHQSHQNQNSKKQELRSVNNSQISPRPVPNISSSRGTSSLVVTPSSSSNSQPQHYQHQRPVNWMTESRTSKKATSRGTSFSVSKLVDQPNPSVPTQHVPDKNYYTEALLSKTSFSNRTGNYNSLEWSQPHYSSNSMNENPFMFQNTHQTTTHNTVPDSQHQHNFQLGFQDPNQSSYYTGNPTSHNQQSQVGISTSQYFVDYGHVGQSTTNPVPPYQQNQHHYHAQGSSVSNFNLSSLFPEIADKNHSKNHNPHMRNPNNNSNTNPQNQNSLNLLDSYPTNTISSGLNNFSNIGIPPFPSTSSGRKHQHNP